MHGYARHPRSHCTTVRDVVLIYDNAFRSSQMGAKGETRDEAIELATDVVCSIREWNHDMQSYAIEIERGRKWDRMPATICHGTSANILMLQTNEAFEWS